MVAPQVVEFLLCVGVPDLHVTRLGAEPEDLSPVGPTHRGETVLLLLEVTQSRHLHGGREGGGEKGGERLKIAPAYLEC